MPLSERNERMNEQHAERIIKLLEKINQSILGIGGALVLIIVALLWQILLS